MIISSCRKDVDNPLKDWFQDPPVSPITQTIKTVVPVGYAASVAMLTLKGYVIPNTKVTKTKSSTLIYINTSTDYPYTFKGDQYGQMIVAALQVDENTALVSVFFTDMDIEVGSFRLLNVIAFPVVYDAINQKITAIYTSMDINLGSNQDIGLDLTQEEIDADLEKLDNQRSDINEVAVAQNAWIIDIYHQGTFNDLQGWL